VPLLLLLATIAFASVAFVRVARAQTGDPLARALTSYRNLEYDDAATRLRALLASTAATRLSSSERSRALVYLGATEVFRGRRDSAIEAFRTLLLADPRYRPDELVFPPEVSALFQETRFGVRAVAVVVPAETEIMNAADRLRISVYATSLHEIRAQITGENGVLERLLHQGTIGDSLELLWNARDFLGRLRAPGRYSLRVTSRSPDGKDEREVEVPLDVERIVQDTLPWPEPLQPSLFRPESEVRGSGVRPLVTGLLAAAAVAVLPSLAGSEGSGTGLRFGVAGAVGIAGVVGLTRASKPLPLPANIEWNRRQRETWQAEVDRVRAENETRIAAARLRIRSGRAVTVEIK
jgi:hypothetical protein